MCSVVSFLEAAQRNVSNPGSINNGTTPTQLWLPTNCIQVRFGCLPSCCATLVMDSNPPLVQELDANYKGSPVSGILTANSTRQTASDCCALCRPALPNIQHTHTCRFTMWCISVHTAMAALHARLCCTAAGQAGRPAGGKSACAGRATAVLWAQLLG